MSLRLRLKKALPPKLLNQILLTFPVLYATPLVDYETNLRAHGGLADLSEWLTTTGPIPGDIIECGASRCGTSAIIAKQLIALGSPKKLFAYDSFEGFDQTELTHATQRGEASIAADAFTSTSLPYVQAKLTRLKLSHIVTPIKGYFQDSLQNFDRPISLALIDCDLYDSMLFCAETLWPHLQPGGVMLFDDTTNPSFTGAKRAVETFIAENQSTIETHGLMQRLYFALKHH